MTTGRINQVAVVGRDEFFFFQKFPERSRERRVRRGGVGGRGRRRPDRGGTRAVVVVVTGASRRGSEPTPPPPSGREASRRPRAGRDRRDGSGRDLSRALVGFQYLARLRAPPRDEPS